MKTVFVELQAHRYPIHIGKDILLNKEILSQYCFANRQVLIVSNETVAQYYLSSITEHLQDTKHDVFLLPDGEQYKSLASFEKIITYLLQKKYDRNCLLLALGGGVIGDIVGFVAACYQRGVCFAQIPTTLLAQVDSAVGGKTAVNHPLGKNMIGAFYQPIFVLADIHVLSTLPDREFSAGLAEVIKYGLIIDQNFFCWLEENIHRVMQREQTALEYIIERSCINKAEVVRQDEKERNFRAILNFGHTFGHAMETALSYQYLLHGEAVGCGMLIAAALSVQLGLFSEDSYCRIKKLLINAKLPIMIHEEIDPDEMLGHMLVDKKVKDGKIVLILLDQIGHAVIRSDCARPAIQNVIQKFLSPR